MEEELIRRRIKVLQEAKEDLTVKINPMLGKDSKTLDLYRELNMKFNELIFEEAKGLVDFSSSQGPKP